MRMTPEPGSVAQRPRGARSASFKEDHATQKGVGSHNIVIIMASPGRRILVTAVSFRFDAHRFDDLGIFFVLGPEHCTELRRTANGRFGGL